MHDRDRRAVSRSVTIDGVHLDSWSVHMEKGHVDAADLIARMSPPSWDAESIDYELRRGSSGAAIPVGFYELEEFGVWSRQARPYLILDRMIDGEFVLSIDGRAYGENIGRPIGVTIGDCTRHAVFGEVPSVFELRFEVREKAHVILFDGVIARSDATSDEPRSLGIGLSRVGFRRFVSHPTPAIGEPFVVDVTDANSREILVGFHAAESWGAWTGQDEAWVQVPELEPGLVEVALDYRSHAASEGRLLKVECGGSSADLPIGDRWEHRTVRLHPTVPTQVLMLSGWRTSPVEGSGDPRALGIGLGGLSVTQREVRRRPREFLRGFARRRGTASARVPEPVRIDAPGKTFLVAIDGHANDPSNSDVVIAFLYAYRHDADALLFLVCSDATISDVFSDVLYLLARVEKCACRMVVVPRDEHGLIPPRLLEVSDVFVRTPTAELNNDDLAAVVHRRPVVVAPRNRIPEGMENGARTVAVPLTRRPDRIPGDEHGYKRSLVEVVTWDDLVDAMRRAGDLVEAVDA